MRRKVSWRVIISSSRLFLFGSSDALGPGSASQRAEPWQRKILVARHRLHQPVFDNEIVVLPRIWGTPLGYLQAILMRQGYFNRLIS